MSLQLIQVQNPFSKAYRSIKNLSLGDGTLLGVIRDNVPPDVTIVASINGHVVPEEKWGITPIIENDVVVCNPVLTGGDSGRQIAAMVAIIAIAVFAPVFVTSAASWGLGMTASTLPATLATVAIVAGGAFLVQALLPPPGLEEVTDSSANAHGFNPQTIQRQGSAIQELFGKNKVTGNVISAFTLPATSNNKQTLRTKIAIGHGPIAPIAETSFNTNVKINDQALENFDEVEVNWRNGAIVQDPIKDYDVSKSEIAINRHVVGPSKAIDEVQLLTKDVNPSAGTFTLTFDGQTTGVIAYDATTGAIETALEALSNLTASDIAVTGKKLSQSGSTKFTFDSSLGDVPNLTIDGDSLTPSTIEFEVVEKTSGRKPAGQPQSYTTVSNDFDSLEIDVGLPKGLFKIDDEGGVSPYKVKIGIEFKATSSGTWLDLTSGEKHSDHKSFTIDGNDRPYVKHFSVGRYNRNIPNIRKGDKIKVTGVTGMTELNGNIYTVHSTGNEKTGGGRHAVVSSWWFRLDVDTSSFTTLVGGGVFQEVTDTIKDSLTSNLKRTYFIPDLIKGTDYDIRVTKYTVEKFHGNGLPHRNYGQDVHFQTIRQVIEEGPFEHPGIAYVGLDALATDQVNGALRFSSIIDGKYIRTYDGTNWGVEASHNPAWVLYHILTQPVLIGAIGYAAKATALLGEIQEWDTSPVASVGTFKITYRGQTTGAIAYDANIATIQTAVDGLSTISSGDVTVSGTGPNNAGSNLIFTWLNTYGTANLFEFDISSMTPSTLDINSIARTREADFSVSRYDGINPTQLDLDTFKELADFCVESVYGGEERIRFNGSFTEKTTMWDAALKICEIARCALIWNGSRISVTIDQSATAVQMFSVGNIVKNTFLEEFICQEDRASELDITYLDEDRDYQRTTFSLLNPALTKVSSKASLNLFGLTKHSEVWRAAQFRLKQNELINRVIVFQAEIDAMVCIVGDVISFQHDVPQWGDGGRVASGSSTTTVKLDAPVTASSGTDKILVRFGNHPTGSGASYADLIEEREVDSLSGDGLTVTVTSAFSFAPDVDDVWIFGEENVSVRKYRIIAMELASDQRVKISAVEYNENIYTIDDLEPITIAVPSTPDSDLLQVTNLSSSNSSFWQEGTLLRQLHVTWDIPREVGYQFGEIYVRQDGTENWGLQGSTFSNNFVLTSLTPGSTYHITVVVTDISGRRGDFNSSPQIQIDLPKGVPDWQSDAIENTVTGVSLLGSPNTNEFTGKDAKFVWHHISGVNETELPAGEFPAGSLGANTWFKDYEVVIKNTDGTIRRTEIVLENVYTYGFEKNSEDGPVVRAFRIEIKARDESGRKSAKADSLTVNNPKPAIPTNVVMGGFYGAYRISWDKSDDLDIRGYKVWVSTSSPVSMIDGNLIYDGPDNAIGIAQDTVNTYYARVAGYDEFGETSLNVAGEVNATTLDPVGADGDDGDDGDDGADGLQGWTTDAVWTSTDADTVSWTAGDLNFSDGTNTALALGSTGNMSALTYIYYNGTGTVQKTTTAATAMGSGNILLGVAINNAGGQATFQMFGGTGGETMLLTTANLASNTVTANEIAGNTITAAELTTGEFVTATANIGEGVIESANIALLNVTSAQIAELTVGTTKITANAVSNIGVSEEIGSTKLAGPYTVVLDKTFDVPETGTYKFSQVSNVTNLCANRRDFDVRTIQVNAITNLLTAATVELHSHDGNDIIRIHGGNYTGWNSEAYEDALLLFDFDNGGTYPYHFYIVNDSETDEVFIKATGGGIGGGWYYNTANNYTQIKIKTTRDLFYRIGKSDDGAGFGATCRIDIITDFDYIGFAGSYAVDNGRDFSIAAKTDVALVKEDPDPRYIFGVAIDNPRTDSSVTPSGTVSAYLEWWLMKK